VEDSVDEMAELREHAAAQAELFNFGVEDWNCGESTANGRIGEWLATGKSAAAWYGSEIKSIATI
jgi:hypothetical protein